MTKCSRRLLAVSIHLVQVVQEIWVDLVNTLRSRSETIEGD
jgi:hypothetical protein